MKKDDAVNSLAEAGMTINNLYGRAWETALRPTEYGWPSSIMSAAMIPVLSAATIGHMVSSAVVQQVPADVFDTVSNLGKP